MSMVTIPMSIDTTFLPSTLQMTTYTPFEVLPNVIKAAPQTWYGNIWSWITLDISHIVITLLAIIFIVNLILNEKKHQSYISVPTSLLLIAVSVFTVWINYSVTFGVIFTACGVWLLTQASRYNKANEEEVVEEPSEVALPEQRPQSSVYTGSGNSNGSISIGPSVSLGTGLGFNLR